MELEFRAARTDTIDPYPFSLRNSRTAGCPGGPENQENQRVPAWTVDWSEMVRRIVDDRLDNVPTETIAARFHRTLADSIAAVAERVGIHRVALSGGCFQNRILLEQSVRALERKGFRVYWHQRIPPNDGGIALGQLNAARILGQQH
jgi:hydrogenase maturation protein HypF